MRFPDVRWARSITAACPLLALLPSCGSDPSTDTAGDTDVETDAEAVGSTNAPDTDDTGGTTPGPDTDPSTTGPDGPCVDQQNDGRCLVETVVPGVSRNTAFADLDGDGDIDAATVLADTPATVWMLTNDTGVFAAPIEMPFAETPTDGGLTASLAALTTAHGSSGDRLLVQGTYGSLGDVRVDLWLGDAGEFSRFYNPTAAPPTGPWLADFDGDGDDDIVFAPTAGSLAALDVHPCDGNSCGPAQETTAADVPPPPPWTIFGADTDADGNDELLVYARDGAGPNATSTVTVLRRNGAAFDVGETAGLGPRLSPFLVFAHDLNGDGQEDLAVASDEGDTASDTDGSQLAVFLAGAGDAFSAGPTLVVSERITGVAFGDVTGDGQADAVIRMTDAASLVVLKGPEFTTGPSYALSMPPTGLSGQAIGRFPTAVADLDGNGTTDIVTVVDVEDSTAGALAVLRAFD